MDNELFCSLSCLCHYHALALVARLTANYQTPFLAKLINNEKTQEIKTSFLTFSYPEDFMFSFGMGNSFMNDKKI